MPQYKFLLHEKALHKAQSYLSALMSGEIKPGNRLADNLKDSDILQNTTKNISEERVSDFVQRLVRSKKPQIFAESQVAGDGSDWNLNELSILGDITLATPVTIFDNGLHYLPQVHAQPFRGALLFVPGALLRNDRGNTPADWLEVTTQNEAFNFGGYNALYERRLMPSLKYASDMVLAQNKRALVTVPGLGCGLFAGKFKGQLGEQLKQVLVKLLQDYGGQLPGIKAVYFDPYREGQNERFEIEGISLMVRPLTQGNEGKAQLCRPQQYAEEGDDFSDCQLFSFVAWDHVSWPGNDFYHGNRMTDDGVKAAATDSMTAITGIEGKYNPGNFKYEPRQGYERWYDVVRGHGIELIVKDNMSILSAGPSGKLKF